MNASLTDTVSLTPTRRPNARALARRCVGCAILLSGTVIFCSDVSSFVAARSGAVPDLPLKTLAPPALK